MLPKLTATQFVRVMTTGRTSPLLCGCEDEDGNHAGEFVVKLLGGSSGALLEIVGSRLASHFGILVPEPAAVEVTQEFARVLVDILPGLARPIEASAGPNFGSRVIKPMSTWLVGRTIPEAMFRDATNVFAFDALIQNPDRRAENPNLFTQADSIYAYDHETSFSFLMALASSAEPWNLEREAYLEKHVFYSRLKAKAIHLGDFANRLRTIGPGTFQRIREEMPPSWIHDHLGEIQAHLLVVQEHAEQFIEQVRRRLA